MDYILKRSKRKSIGLEVTDEGLLVRTPMRTSRREIERCIRNHQTWIAKRMRQREQVRMKAATEGFLTELEIRRLTDEARSYIPRRVAYYADLLGVHPNRITIRCQKTRWGSCSAKGNLNFNCLLMLTPPEVIDSVVVHEVCHLLEMNHSKRFYEYVYRVYPEYKKHHGWLKKHGSELMARVER